MSAALDLESLNAMSADALAARLSGAAVDRLQIIYTAAKGGVAEAQAVYAQMLLDGHEIAANPRAAFHWFNRAAKQQHLLALNMVGRCYELGWGAPIDLLRAGECFRVAAERGLPAAMYNHATRLALGEGVTQDRVAALNWFRKAAQGDDALMAAKSENYIGSFHEDGWVVPKDRTAATRHYRIAAEGGDFRGQFNLARMLIEAGDTDAALEWLGLVPRTATSDFMEKARAWIARSPDAHLRRVGNAALAT